MRDFCEDKYYRNILSNLPLSDCNDGIVFYIFNDKSFPSAMSFLEKTGYAYNNLNSYMNIKILHPINYPT